MRIILAGGGTAGHINPLIAVVQALKQIAPKAGIDKLRFVFVGPTINNKLWESLLAKEGIKIKNISAGKIRRYFSLANAWDMAVRLPLGILQSLWHVFWN